MKETVNVNIGSVAFILDEDAYRVLGSYFDDIRRRLPEGDAETMGDIEARVAEIFRERVASPMRVITLDVVRATMAQMGSPPISANPRRGAVRVRRGRDRNRIRRTAAPAQTLPLAHRAFDRRHLRGLAAYFDSDPTLIRLLMLLLILFGGLSIWAYIILWIVIPEEPARKFNINSKNR